MGYTHYWHDDTYEITDELIADFKKIFEIAKQHNIIIRNWEGLEEPELSIDRISFNGDADTQDDYETAVFRTLKPNQDPFNFCKTGEHPYDAVVCACLIRIQALNPTFKYESDGNWSDELWRRGRDLYKETFGVDAVAPSWPKEYM